MNTEAERQRYYQEDQCRRRERGTQSQPEVHAEPARAHAEAARSCAVPQRANVGDAKALRADTVPPEADAGRARVTLGKC